MIYFQLVLDGAAGKAAQWQENALVKAQRVTRPKVTGDRSRTQTWNWNRYLSLASVLKYSVGAVPSVFPNMEMNALGVL